MTNGFPLTPTQSNQRREKIVYTSLPFKPHYLLVAMRKCWFVAGDEMPFYVVVCRLLHGRYLWGNLMFVRRGTGSIFNGHMLMEQSRCGSTQPGLNGHSSAPFARCHGEIKSPRDSECSLCSDTTIKGVQQGVWLPPMIAAAWQTQHRLCLALWPRSAIYSRRQSVRWQPNTGISTTNWSSTQNKLRHMESSKIKQDTHLKLTSITFQPSNKYSPTPLHSYKEKISIGGCYGDSWMPRYIFMWWPRWVGC